MRDALIAWPRQRSSVERKAPVIKARADGVTIELHLPLHISTSRAVEDVVVVFWASENKVVIGDNRIAVLLDAELTCPIAGDEAAGRQRRTEVDARIFVVITVETEERDARNGRMAEFNDGQC